jgi:hypothetical protein
MEMKRNWHTVLNNQKHQIKTSYGRSIMITYNVAVDFDDLPWLASKAYQNANHKCFRGPLIVEIVELQEAF